MRQVRPSVYREEETERTERTCINDAADTESESVDRRCDWPLLGRWRLQWIARADESNSECRRMPT